MNLMINNSAGFQHNTPTFFSLRRESNRMNFKTKHNTKYNSLFQVLAKRLGCSVVMTDAEKVVVGVGVGMSVAATAVLAKKLIDWLFGDKDS